MASTFLGLTISYSGLQAAQASINTTAHNVSNVSTTGYSRQKVSLEADKALNTNSGYGTIGSGVVVTGVEQIRDSYYDVKFRNNQTNYGEYEAKENYMTQIEDYLNEFKLSGFTTEYTNFFKSVTELQKTPTEKSVQNSVINNALSLSQYFNTLSTNLTNVQKDANEEIKNQVGEINTIAQNISSLNKQINYIEANKGSANDLRDKRNNLLDQLSKIVNIDTEETDIGNGLKSCIVKINGQTLVDTYDYNTLTTQAITENVNASDADGLYNIVWKNGLEFNEYSSSLNGSLKGLIDVRDGCNGSVETLATDASGNKSLELVNNTEENTAYKGVPHYISKLNEFIETFTSAVNEILTNGKTVSGEAGIPLFTVKSGFSAMSALSVSVNDKLIKDVSKLATTTDPSQGSAYCDVVDNLVALKSDKRYEGGTGAYFLESVVAEVAIDSAKSTSFFKNYTNISSAINNQRLSVMGVDQDEEGMDILKFQQAYSLSSKMMSVMNEIYNKLINETGL
ncbi:flagellar hook-associated protein FlgK [[Clostridium] fimetarium]|uniref:Flagellar hook-associated protein 1 n=1 Tax=[Clostridium] fimetarium TaxID=99656 RepID=A0A1I0P5Q5_9FIRM|nr:flagellar hook-associated protein FlgK [[Clostridium] fimetarium]SEW08847.1 flagellar hook-associated protein 1 FlgK [[Clostridium] fimetarium]